MSTNGLVLPIIHAGVMGEFCAGKSKFGATFPKPMLVVNLDGYGKDQAYLDAGIVDPTRYEGEFGQPITVVKSRKQPDAILIQIEYFHDIEPTEPTAFDMLWRRWPTLRAEVVEGRWKTVALETFSSLDLFARWRRTYGMLKVDKPNILATDDVEQMLGRFNGLPCNVFVACHVDKDREVVEGVAKQMPMGPGRLRKGFANLFASELYRVYTVNDEKGNVVHQLQTGKSQDFECGSRIMAPNPCYPAYKELFVNWRAKQAALNAAAAAKE